MKMSKPKTVGMIGNYYGGLFIVKQNGKFYWAIENWDFSPDKELPDESNGWEEIPESLYNELKRFRKK